MKFEIGHNLEVTENEEKEARGEKLSWWQNYRRFNKEEINTLIEFRKKHGEEFANQHAEKLKNLLEAEKNGELIYTKK